MGWWEMMPLHPDSFISFLQNVCMPISGSNRINGTTVLGIKDPNLQWEVAKEFDIGVEFAMFGRRLTGEIGLLS